MTDVAFGQYYPAESFVHKCDPRTKLLFLIVYIVSVFLSQSFYAIGACALVFAVICIFSGVPFSSLLKSVKAVIFLLVFMAVLNLFFYEGQTVLWEWKFIRITKEAIFFTIFLAARLFLLVLGSSLLTLTTTPVALADGIESLLSPLKLIKFPVHALALIMSIALRFIPILTDETQRIMNAQKARGADFDSGNIIDKAKALIPILIPLLIAQFRRAEELATAMECRCYRGGGGRTRMTVLRFTLRDFLAAGATIALCAGIILLNIYFPSLL